MRHTRDAYDAMLLTPQQTTVVKQHTNVHDNMPVGLYGSQSDEENLFAGIGADPQADAGNVLSTAANSAQAAVDEFKAVANAVKPPVAAPKPAGPNWLLIGGLLLVGSYFLMPKRK